MGGLVIKTCRAIVETSAERAVEAAIPDKAKEASYVIDSRSRV